MKSTGDKEHPAGSGSGTVTLEKRFELAEGFVKAVLSLSTGALVFSVTFLHEIIGIGAEGPPREIHNRYLIAASWLAFLVSVGSALYYLYFLAVAAKFERGYGNNLKWGSLAAIYSFAAGLFLLGLFAWFNLPSAI